MLREKWISGPARGCVGRTASFVLLVVLAARAPLTVAASTEEVLRGRVEQLYNALRQSDWQKAEKYLTKESRPTFRKQSKRALAGYQIDSIKLEPSGETAVVVVGIPLSGGAIPNPVLVPQTTHWRRVRGTWYLDLSGAPTGQSLSGAGGQNRSPPSLRAKDLKFQSTWTSVGIVHKGEVKTARFAFTNVSQRAVTLADVETDCPCLRMKSQQKEFKPGEAGVIEFELDPSIFSFDVRQALTLTASIQTEPEHALTRLTVAAVLVPDSEEPSPTPPASPRKP